MLAAKLLPAACAFAAGAVFALQALFNSANAGHLGGPAASVLLSMVVSAATLSVVCLLVGLPLPTPSALAGAPAWLLPLGGVCGAIILTTVVFVTPVIGAAATFALLVAGQLAAALIIDHLGPLGAPEHPMTWLRGFGVLVVAAGAAIVLAS